jgi:hypothetical protein
VTDASAFVAIGDGVIATDEASSPRGANEVGTDPPPATSSTRVSSGAAISLSRPAPASRGLIASEAGEAAEHGSHGPAGS